MSTDKKIKIGILGSKGTGKTTYISMLQYLMSSNKHPNIMNSYIDNVKIKNNIISFLEVDKWDDLASKIGATFKGHKDSITFDIHHQKHGSKIFEIQDYSGESIYLQEDNQHEEIYEYLLSCDALLLFLDGKEYDEEVESQNRKRWDEFQKILYALFLKDQRLEIEIPLYLIITKSDKFNIGNDFRDTSPFLKKHIQNRYKDIDTLIKHFNKKNKAFSISSKTCFELYIKGDETDSEQAEIFCAPVLMSLKEIRKKNELFEEDKLKEIKRKEKKKKRASLNKIGLIILTIIIMLVSLYGFSYVMYKNEISKKISIESLKDYKEDSYIWLYPSLIEEVDERIDNKIKYKFNELKKEFIEIKTPKEQEDFIEKLNKFKNNHSQSYKEKIKDIYDTLVKKEFDKLKIEFLKLKGYEEELNFIANINHFREKFPEYYNQEIDNLHSTLEVKLFALIKKESKNPKKIDFSINLISKFLEKFDLSKYKEEVLKIKSILEIKKENNAFTKIVKAISRRDDIDSIISYCKSYTSNFLKRSNKVEKIQKNAELLKNILQNSENLKENTKVLNENLVRIRNNPSMLEKEKNLKTLEDNGMILKRDFEMVLSLCEKHINLKSSYLNKTRATPCANAKVAKKKYREYEKIMNKYESYQWKPFLQRLFGN